MEKKKFLIILPIFMLLSLSIQAQKKERKIGIHKNLIRTTGSYAFGYGGKEWKYNLYGEAGFLLTEHIEVNGGVTFQLGSSDKYSINRLMGEYVAPGQMTGDYRWHGVWWGAKYHFLTEKQLDIYAGFQPGMAAVFTGENYSDWFGYQHKEFGVAPFLTECAGVAFYGSFFHLYAEARFIQGKYHSPQYSLPLHELRLSFGLGFNIL